MAFRGFVFGNLILFLSAWSTALSAETLRVGYTDFPPYSFSVQASSPDGLSIDIINEAAARTGYDLTYHRFDNPGALVAALAAGEIDLTVPLAITEPRGQAGAFTARIFEFNVSLVFSDPPPPGGLAGDLDGLKVAVSRGSLPDRLISASPGVTIVYHDTFAERLLALLTGEVDAVGGPAWQLRTMAAESGVASRLHEETLDLRSSPAALLVDAGRPALVAELDAYIAQAQRSGSLAALQRKWLTPLRLSPREWAAKNIGIIVAVSASITAALLGAVGLQMFLNRIRSRESSRTRTMIEAFDLARTGIVVYDENLRAEMSNSAFEHAFPGQVAGVRAGLTLPEMFRRANRNGYFGEVYNAEDIEAQIAENIKNLERGEGFEATVVSADGRLFARRGLKLSGGRVAIVTTDVSEVENGRRDLAQKAAELERANESLETFTRVAAHDLKSPASSVATLLDWIAEDFAAAEIDPPEGTMETIAKARKLLRRQVTLIDDLLAYTRAATTGGDPVRLDPREQIAGVLELVGRPEGFTVEIEGDLPLVVADSAGFDLVIRNLVANAIKHHDRKEGRVSIRAESIGPSVAFEVADDGPGIPSAFAERVFEPFFKLRSHEDVHGSGLGLSMIRAAVSAWGGEISLACAEAGRGTTVRFTVPAARAPDLSTAREADATAGTPWIIASEMGQPAGFRRAI